MAGSEQKIIPIVLSHQVVFPGWTYVLELSTSDERAMIHDLLNSCQAGDTTTYIGVVPMKTARKVPKAGDIGCYAELLSCTRNLNEQDVLIRVAGKQRMIIEEITSTSPYCAARIRVHHEPEESPEQIIEALQKENLAHPHIQRLLLNSSHRFDYALEGLTTQFNFSTNERISLLESLSFSQRLIKFLSIAVSKVGSDQVKNFGAPSVFFGPAVKQLKISDARTHPILIPRMSAKTLGLMPGDQVGTKLAAQIQEANMPAEVRKVALEDLARFNSTPPHGSEHAHLRNYLETLVALPWNVSSQDHIDIKKAQEELDRDHYAMEKVKRRVLEYLAVKQLKKSQLRGPILCFVGPPGVGKTSIARSIASILGRKFHRIGLGGICDASDIRGSRRTYIGSMPGRIIKALQFCGTNNPVVLLDEIDKMSSGRLNHGDPMAALLEVLDPEQNSQFTDHYLGVPFNLSKIVFIATANSIDNIPPALRDRIELIRVNGYTEEEKFHIARSFVIPKALIEHGLDSEQVVIPDETLRFIIASYTREAGVRSLERKLGAVMRDAALKIAAALSNDETPLTLLIDVETARAVLGGPRYSGADLHWTDGTIAGVVVGLSVSQIGGNILPIEASKIIPGRGKLILTGQAGDVLSESAKIAFDWFKTALLKYQLYEDVASANVHIHLPAGSINKEGPSAGIAMATALVSLFSGIPPLPKLALTGEITLQGFVLPVGGLKEKLAAAHKAGITKVIIPKKCRDQLDDIPQHLQDALELIMVDHMSEVIDCAFGGAITENSSLVSKL